MLLSTKLKSKISEINITLLPLQFKLKNNAVNGNLRGCSGHIINTSNSKCVYINTEGSCYEPLKCKVMYRYAENDKDYSSLKIKNGNNRWCEPSELPQKIISMLES